MQAMILESLFQFVLLLMCQALFNMDISSITIGSGDDDAASNGTSDTHLEVFKKVYYWYFQSSETSVSDDKVQFAQQHIVSVIIVLFLASFVMAAGIEETMKHFAVRNCLMISPLKDPHSILCYLLSAALGFATAENILYVLGSAATPPIEGFSMVVGQVIVLGLRWLCPVHPICAVLQAVNMSYAVMNIQSMSLFWVLFPAIFTHGIFDFVMFLASAFSFIYGWDSLNFLIGTVVCAATIVIASLVWGCLSFKRVQSMYESRWSSLRGDDDDDLTIRFD
jgi:RsiW-degrading membrane proteinase PrsW (M82 family)